MTPYQKILVTTDFSDPSVLGIEQAERLAAALSAELVLVHVVTTPPPSELDRATKDKIMLDRRRKAKASLRDLFTNPNIGVETRTIVTSGDPAEQILSVAEDEVADLIVMASHGRSPLGRLFLGSVAAAVLHKSECPLLIVPFQKDQD